MPSIKTNVIISSIFLLFNTYTAYAQTNDQISKQHDRYRILTPQEIIWKTGPNSLPKGAMLAVLEGDPSKPGPFTIRLKFPANYKIPPHFHPSREHVTILLGTLNLGMGDTFDPKNSHALPETSFMFMESEMHHYAFTHEPTIIQLHGVGPWGIVYMNPKDDPRKNV